MRFVSKILSFVALVAFCSSAAAAPNFSITLESVRVNYASLTDGSVVLDTTGGGAFTDFQDCLTLPGTTSNLGGIWANDPDFKQMFAIALAALLEGKLIDVEISNTGNPLFDCLQIGGGYGIPVILSITVHK